MPDTRTEVHSGLLRVADRTNGSEPLRETREEDASDPSWHVAQVERAEPSRERIHYAFFLERFRLSGDPGCSAFHLRMFSSVVF